MKSENEEEIIEFIEAVFEREHLRREFRRVFESIDTLTADMDRKAEQTFLINLRSRLDESAAKLDVVEQTVDALLPHARAYRGMLALSSESLLEEKRDSNLLKEMPSEATASTLMPNTLHISSASPMKVKAPSFEAPPFGTTVERALEGVGDPVKEVDPFDESPPDRPDRIDEFPENMAQVQVMHVVEEKGYREEDMLFWNSGNETDCT